MNIIGVKYKKDTICNRKIGGGGGSGGFTKATLNYKYNYNIKTHVIQINWKVVFAPHSKKKKKKKNYTDSFHTKQAERILIKSTKI